MKICLILFAMFTFCATSAFGDVRLPDTPKPTPSRKSKEISGTMLIQIDANAKEAVLRLNKNQARQLRASLDEIDNADEMNAGFNFSRTQTIVSGLFLSLAMVFGGVWLSRSKSSKAVAGLILLAIVGASATLVFANAGPPSSLRRFTSRIFSNDMKRWRQSFGSVKIKIVDANAMTDSNNAVELVVPQAEEDKQSE